MPHSILRPVMIAGAMLTLAAGSPVATAAYVQDVLCGTPSDVAEALQEVAGEEELLGGVSRQGILTLVYGNLESATWTLVAASPKEACAVSYGTQLQVSTDAREVEAVTGTGGIMSIAADDDESWTIKVTMQQGIMSMTTILTGEGWSPRRSRLPGV